MKQTIINALKAICVFSIILLIGCKKSDSTNLPDKEPKTEEKPITKDTLKILAIGNSFSEDAIETHLYDMAKADDKYIIIGNLFIGGASLELHLNNVTKNENAYSFRKIDINGKKTTTPNISISTALKNENWSNISFQQASPFSGIYSTWTSSLPGLYNYISNNLNNKNAKFIIHQTWAYAQNSTHDGFKNYNNNQKQMYNSIIDAVNKASKLVKIDHIVPVGTAIQNGRTSSIGDNFTRDGYHLSIPLGRYVAACTWYEALFNKSVIDNKYKPIGLSELEISIAKNAAHFALLKPNEISKIDY